MFKAFHKLDKEAKEPHNNHITAVVIVSGHALHFYVNVWQNILNLPILHLHDLLAFETT